MKNIFLSLLFILTVSFAFANDIKKDDDNKGKKQVETKQTTKAINQKTQSAKPDAVFTCVKEVETDSGETVLVVISNSKTELSSKENIQMEYGILCRMTVSGTTDDGIKYKISGSCSRVKKMLKKIGAI